MVNNESAPTLPQQPREPYPREAEYKTYHSELAEKYGSPEMKAIWSPYNRWLRTRDVWIAVAEVQAEVGLVSPEEIVDLKAHRDDIDVYVINQRERNKDFPGYTGHDILAGRSEYADKAPKGGRILHQGLTSEDLLSNVEVLLIKDSLDLIEQRLVGALGSFGEKVLEYKDDVCLGYTHLQAAEPTTVGYRLAGYGDDLLTDLTALRQFRDNLKGKGIKGPVGTSGSIAQVLEGTGMTPKEHEDKIMAKLDLKAEMITGQTYSRKTTLEAVHRAAQIGVSAHKFAGDVKQLQSSHFDEWAEPRDQNDSGSSAMPFKANPRHVEQIKGVARSLPGNYQEAWQMASEVTLERGLEDSAGKRDFLPDTFLQQTIILGG